MKPEWLKEDVAYEIAKAACLNVGEIATLKYPVRSKGTVWNFFAVLCVSPGEYRYFDTEEQAAAMRVLRGLSVPEITIASASGKLFGKKANITIMDEWVDHKSARHKKRSSI
jgi:hypothetical protein